MNYYNEFDPKAAAWLRQLIADGLIPAGDIDTRSIADVQSDDLAGYTQCHFFAGIGGWSYALQLARIPSTRRLWTGSCPCQPFSSAGAQKAFTDERHLWPHFFRLINVCRPPVVFGEQVASKVALQWFDGVSTDLEGAGYACAAADLCAAGVGSPHIRQRLYWVAYANGGDTSAKREQRSRQLRQQQEDDSTGRLGDAQLTGLEGRSGDVDGRDQPRRLGADSIGPAATSGAAGAWDRYAVAHCTDGRSRRFEPESFPLADGVPDRVGLLRGFGNAIVPQVAAQFVLASEEARTFELLAV